MKSYQVVDELDDAVCFVWTVVPELREALLSGLDALVCVRVGTRHVVSSEQLQNVLFVFEQLYRCLEVFVVFGEQNSSSLFGLFPQLKHLILSNKKQDELLKNAFRNAMDYLKL